MAGERRGFRVRLKGSGCREEAGSLAIKSVHAELVDRVLNRANEPYSIDVDEISEIALGRWWIWKRVRGSGFTFFPDDG